MNAMPMTRARRQYLVLAWTGVVLTWIASVVLEVLLLDERAPLAMTITSAIALVVGLVATRRAFTEPGRASIKIDDLRGETVRRPKS